MSSNLKVSYLLRDEGNYKIHGEFILSNPLKIPSKEVQMSLEPILIRGEFFLPEKWGVTPLNQNSFGQPILGEWHEISEIELTQDKAQKKWSNIFPAEN